MKKDYKEIFDRYGIKYRCGTDEEVSESIKVLDEIFYNTFIQSVTKCKKNYKYHKKIKQYKY